MLPQPTKASSVPAISRRSSEPMIVSMLPAEVCPDYPAPPPPTANVAEEEPVTAKERRISWRKRNMNVSEELERGGPTPGQLDTAECQSLEAEVTDAEQLQICKNELKKAAALVESSSMKL